MAARQFGCRIDTDMPAVGHHDPAVDDHVGDVTGGGREHHGLRCRAAPGGAYGVEVDRHQVGSRADSELPGIGPPERVLSAGGGRVQAALGAPMMPRCSRARRSSSSTARASSNMSITAWLSEPRLNKPFASSSAGAGPIPSPRSRSVVGQKHTPVAVSVMVADVFGMSDAWRAPRWSGVRARRRPAARPSAFARAPRCTGRSRPSAPTSARAAASSCAVGPFDDGRHVFDRDPAHGMQCGADENARVGLRLLVERLDSLGPAGSAAVAEALLRPVVQRRPVGSRTEIAGVEQRQAQSRVGGSLRSARGPSRWGPNTAARRRRGAGSGTRRPK